MIVFRCSRCSKINISADESICLHCDNDESILPAIPEIQTKGKVLNNSTNVIQKMENQFDNSDFIGFFEASEIINTTKLDGKENSTETLNANLSHICLSQEKSCCNDSQYSVLRDLLSSKRPNACSNVPRVNNTSIEYDGNVQTRKPLHFSEHSSCGKNKNYFLEKIIRKSKSKLYVEKIRKTEYDLHKKVCNLKKASNLVFAKCHQFLANKLELETHIRRSILYIKQIIENENKIAQYSGKILSRRNYSVITNGFQDDLKTNAISHHFIEEASCSECSNIDIGNKMPVQKIKLPRLQKHFVCDKYGKQLTNESEFNAHFTKHSKEKLFNCGTCAEKHHLKRYYDSHSNKGPFKCDICNIVYARSCHLNLHRKKHILEMAFTASTCQKELVNSFRQRQHENNADANPQQHLQSSLKEKTFPFTQCGTRITRDLYFNSCCPRQRGHNIFECEKEFPYEFRLNTHHGIYTLERPFVCKFCDFTAIRMSHLNKHLQIH